MRKNIKTYVMIGLLLLTTGKYGYATNAVIVPFDSDRWEFSNPDPTHHRIENYLGQPALTGMVGTPYYDFEYATLKDVDFKNGIIEMDVAFPQLDAYTEIRWHSADRGQGRPVGKQCDKLYLRPEKSSFSDAVQYAPIINGISNWQIYYLPDNTKAATFLFDQWFHVKIVTVGKYAEVYVVDMEVPVLTVNLVGNSLSGNFVLQSMGSHLANFSYTIDDNPPVKGKPPEIKAEPTAIKSWLISNAFEEKALEGKHQVTEEDRKALTWVNLDSETDGKGNIARVQDSDNITAKPSRNTVFARATIVSDKDQIKLMTFGFSDKVKLYLNGQVLYQENQAYHSRNEWFMGNMGYFNELYLPLNKGNNELWMGISEGTKVYTGWGVEAKFENLDGITFDNTKQIDLGNRFTVDGAASAASAADGCMAKYSLADGRVHIPCISVPDNSGGAIVYEADIVQLPLAPGIYVVDENSLKRH
jgi:hypothetical protein